MAWWGNLRLELVGGLALASLRGGRKCLNACTSFGISVVAGILFVAVNEFEPDRRLALTLKFLILAVSVAATAGRLTN